MKQIKRNGRRNETNKANQTNGKMYMQKDEENLNRVNNTEGNQKIRDK